MMKKFLLSAFIESQTYFNKDVLGDGSCTYSSLLLDCSKFLCVIRF